MVKKKQKQVENIKKLTKKEIHLKFLKDNLDNKKRVYEKYIQVLVKYNIKNVAYSAIMSEEHFQIELRKRLDLFRNNSKSFMEFMFGKPGLTEEERIESNIDYYDKLIKYAQHKIEMMGDEIKIKIAKDAVEKGVGWLKLCGDNYKDSEKKIVKRKAAKIKLSKSHKKKRRIK